MPYEKLNKQPGQLLLASDVDHIEKGIVDNETDITGAKARLDYIESKISDVLYKAIKVDDLSTTLYVPFGDSVSNRTLIWTASKDAKYLKISTPNGTTFLEAEEGDETNASLLVGNKQHNVTDTGNYIVNEPIFWSFTITESEGKKINQGGEITTEFATLYPSLGKVYPKYLFYWGKSAQDSGFDATFIKGLQNNDSYNHSTAGFPSVRRYYEFPKGEDNASAINEEYIFFAFPEGSQSADDLYYDVNNSNFRTPLKKVTIPSSNGGDPITNFELDFSGSKLNYCLYRSVNKVSSKETVRIYIS